MMMWVLWACGSKRLPLPAQSAALPTFLRARFSVKLDTPSFKGSTRGVMIVGPDGQLRIDVLSPFNTPLAQLATDGHGVDVHLIRQADTYVSEDVGAVLAALVDDGVEIAHLTQALTGRSPYPPTNKEGFEVALDEHQAWVTLSDGLLSSVTVPEILTIQNGDWTHVDDVVLPTTVEVVVHKANIAATLHHKAWEFPEEVGDVFRLPGTGPTQDLLDVLAQE